MDQIDVKSFPLTELVELLRSWGEPPYRAKQIYAWLHRKHVASFSDMTDLSGALRESFAEKCYINSLNIKKRLVSQVDGTVKYLYELRDGERVESVLMHYNHGTSLCISTQVGCRMGCRFCASTIGGFRRNLTPSEMLDQVYAAGADAGERISNVVLMGIGEPLDNLENVLKFLTILSSPQGLNLSLRHVSLSTCGLVEGIDALAEHKLPLTLSVSLHAVNNETRDQVMPVNKIWQMEELLAACNRYFQKTGRRISFEYALIEGVNDSPETAKKLAEVLRSQFGPKGQGMLCHVNLIPVNPVAERDFHRSGREAVYRFQKVLEDNGINATVRRELGSDIAAACGQLRRDSME